ncbi:MAG TPA: hypothetical protein VD913_06410, partial [bacterium]|nr:hypothetical protein [bacterium]
KIEVRSRLDNFEEPGIDEEVAVEILKHLADPSGYLDHLLLGFITHEMKARERLRLNSLERLNAIKQNRPNRNKRYDVLGFSRAENEKINKWFPLYLSEIEKGIEEGKIFSYKNGASSLGMSFEFFLGFEPVDLTEESEISKEEAGHFIETGGLYTLTQDLMAGFVEIESFEGERFTTVQRAEFAKRLSSLAKEFFVRAVSAGHVALVHKGGRLSKLRVRDAELLGAGPRSEVRNHGVLVSGRDIHPDKSVRDYLQLLIQTLEKTIQPRGFDDQTVLLENPEEKDSLFQKADAVFKDSFISQVIKEILDEVSNPKWKNYSPEIARIRLGQMIERLNQKTGLKGYIIGFREEEELDSLKDRKTYQVYQVDAALPQEIRGIPFLAWLLREKASALTADFVTQVSTSETLKEAENIYKKIQKKPESFEAKFYLKDFPKAAQSAPEAKDDFIQDFAWNILEHTLLEEVFHRMHDLLRFQRFEIREVKSAMEEERVAKMGTVALSPLPFFAVGFSILHSSHRKDIQKLFSTGFLGELSLSPSNIGRFYPFVEIAARLGEKSAKAFVRKVQQSVDNEEGDLDDGVFHLGQTGPKFRIPVGRIAEHLLPTKSRVLQDTAASLYQKRTGLNPVDLGSLPELADQIRALKALGIKFGKDGFEFSNSARHRSEMREKSGYETGV